MQQDSATPVAVSDCEVMASVDDGEDGERLVIAELCQDGAYLSMSTETAAVLENWR